MAKKTNSEMTPAPAQEKEFVTSLEVVTDAGHVHIPVNSENNRFKSQIVAAKLRKIMDEQIELRSMMRGLIPIEDLKDLVTACAKVEDIARFSYARDLLPDEGGETAMTTAEKMVKAVADGMTTANLRADTEDRMKRIAELGKKPKPSGRVIIDVE